MVSWPMTCLRRIIGCICPMGWAPSLLPRWRSPGGGPVGWFHGERGEEDAVSGEGRPVAGICPCDVVARPVRAEAEGQQHGALELRSCSSRVLAEHTRPQVRSQLRGGPGRDG
eukprot:9643073-Lingulodinium_polyedra.AAC.1